MYRIDDVVQQLIGIGERFPGKDRGKIRDLDILTCQYRKQREHKQDQRNCGQEQKERGLTRQRGNVVAVALVEDIFDLGK